jgi:uncharacterized protein (DUF697 family)
MIWKAIKFVLGGLGVIIGAYIAVDSWVIMRAETVTKPLEQKLMAVRSADKEHFEDRFDRVELKLDEIKILIEKGNK